MTKASSNEYVNTAFDEIMTDSTAVFDDSERSKGCETNSANDNPEEKNVYMEVSPMAPNEYYNAIVNDEGVQTVLSAGPFLLASSWTLLEDKLDQEAEHQA